MKKILLLVVIMLFPLILHAADTHFTGSGTYLDPYTGGTLGGTSHHDESWSGTIYVSGDLTIGNYGHLTINDGTVIKFMTSVADLIINGTGQLTSAGSSGSGITFTADYDDDGHEAGETWGHISFEGSTGNSTLEYCTIEYGSKTGGGIEGYGGGIHANTSNLTISYCTIQNNSALWGGGIFVNKTRYPGINNCIIKDNTASNGGGGLYFWNDSYSTVTNCLIFSNDVIGSLYYGGGGVFIGPSSGNVKIINCTFANNTAVLRANEIEFMSSSNAKIINSILWGSNVPYVGAFSSSFENCAIQGGYPTGSVGCINLNSNNSHGAGPNFKQTDGSDWSIKVISPCRDAGTTPSPTVPTDYAGNSRVRTYDIGAYEVQYNYWLTSAGSTDWATGANWNGGVPTSSQNIVITTGATYYPTGDVNLDFTIGSGYGLVLDPGAKATFNTLTKNGDLKLMSDASNISSLITNNSVNTIVELYLTGGGSPNYKWHYISSPVSSLPVSTFAPTPTINFAQYFEARPTTDPLQGWIGYDGYIYYGGGFLTGLPYDIRGTNLTVGKGYNYYYTSDYKFTFSGNINVSSVSPTITYGGSATLHGFNLLGNPFSSGLNWTTIIDDAGFPTSTSKGLYFTRDNSQCSFIAGVGYPDESVTGIIPPMQGFFIHTSNTSTTLPLLAGARAHDIPARYKGEKEIIPLVRLQLDNDNLKDNTVIRFDTKASTSLDDDFDAVRMFLTETIPYIYSSDGTTKYAINGQPYPDQFVEIPVIVNIINEGIHSITATQLQGLESYNTDLKDIVTGFTTRLNTIPVLTFSSSAGLITDRFILKISNVVTSTENPVIYDNNFNIYYGLGLINIQTIADEWDGKVGSVKVFDLAGKTITDLQNNEFSKNSVIQVQAPDAIGLYVIEIRSGVKRFVGKVIVK